MDSEAKPSRKRRRPPARLFLIAVLVSLGASFHFGFQLTMTNAGQAVFVEFLNGSIRAHFDVEVLQSQLEALWSCTVAILFVGALFGSLCIRQCAERLGRKRGLIVAFFLNLISFGVAILSYFINSFELYAASRVSIGFAVALSVGMAGMFVTECSPKECRGSISMTMGLMMQSGTMAGAVIGMPQVLGRPDLWWWIYVVESAPLLLVLAVFLFVLHETPSFLLSRGDETAARRALCFYYAPANSADVIDAALAELRRDALQHCKSSSMLEVMREPGYTRQSALIGCVTSVALVFSGTAVIAAYAVDIFRRSGLTLTQASIANVGLSLTTVISSVISTFIVDQFGRRRLLLSMYTAMLAINIGIFGLLFVYEKYRFQWAAFGLLAMFVIFAFCFAMGPGPLTFFMTSEMMTQRTRSAGQSWMYTIQMICRTIALAAFLPLQNWLGGSWTYLLLFVAPIAFAVIFFYVWLPETKNRSVVEIQHEFERMPTFITKFSTIFVLPSSRKDTTFSGKSASYFKPSSSASETSTSNSESATLRLKPWSRNLQSP